MSWIDRLEPRLGRFAIPHLVVGLVFLNALTWVLLQMNPYFALALTLEPAKVMSGEVWRLFTFLFIPGTSSVFVIFNLMMLYMVGGALEAEWGIFRLNVYYLIGMIGTIISAFFFRADPTGAYLNLSLTFAFATLYPNFQFFLIVIPIKIKWLALFYAAFVVYDFLFGGNGARLAILTSFLNYFIFFMPIWLQRWRGHREVEFRRQIYESKREPVDPSGVLHTCAVCGRTDVSNPELDFRVSSLDEAEYCREHLPKAQS